MKSSATNKDAVQRDRSEIHRLLHLSSRIGRDPMLVQASSGNASLKLNETLWIKASGKWLANADREEILVPVRLSECLECLVQGRSLPARNGSPPATHLRPSVETLTHAVLPQRVVIHAHSVNTITWAIRSDALVHLSEKLSGLRWQWIPYALSGLPLAREIQTACSRSPGTDVFVLANHGLVVCGEDCDTAESLLFEVERRLNTDPRVPIKPRCDVLERVQRLARWQLPDTEGIHTLGTDPISLRIAKGGVLYPCQAIFLGRTLPGLPYSSSKPLPEVTSGIYELGESTPFLVIEGSGVLVREEITAAEYAVLHGFAEVVRRVQASAPVRYLTNEELKSVLGAEGHHYRMSAENGTMWGRLPRSKKRDITSSRPSPELMNRS